MKNVWKCVHGIIRAATLPICLLPSGVAFGQSIYNPNAATPTIPPYPQVANTTTLRASCTRSVGCPTGDAVYPIGVWRNTDGVAGGPPLFYAADTGSVCSADDGGKCVAAANGGYWLGQFAGDADIRQWGVSTTVPDNTVALNNALCLSGLSSFIIPPGIYKFASPISCTLPSPASPSVVGYTLKGAGSDVSTLEYDGTGKALALTCGTTFTAFHIRDFTFTTSRAGAANGLAITCLASASDEYVPFSDITNVSFRGADGYLQTDFWGTAYSLTDTSQWNLTTYCTGPSHSGGYAGATNSGICAALAGIPSSNYGVVYNFSQSTFNVNSIGIQYGAYIQGVTVSQSNFTGVYTGILAPTGGVGADELTVENGNQFNVANAGIDDQVGINSLIISGNLFIVPSNAAFGVNLEAYSNFNINNNQFDYTTGGAGTGIKVGNGVSASISWIDGNTFYDLATGINISSAADDTINIGRGNSYPLTTTPIINNVAPVSFASHINIFGMPTGIFGIQSSTTLTNNGGFLEATFTSTANFYTGQWVTLQAINASNASLSVTLPTQIDVLDSTHVVFTDFGYSSGYGAVNMAPIP